MRHFFNPRNGATIISVLLGSAGFVMHRVGDFMMFSPVTTLVVVVAIYLGVFKPGATQVFFEEVLMGLGRGLVKAIEDNKPGVVVTK